jgi:hypothetical protein
MRLSRNWLMILALLFTLTSIGLADDTKEFLNPENWEGRSDIWKLENNTLVGETKEDPKYNTFFCSKQKYSDFELSFKVTLRDEVGNSGVQIRSELFDKEKFRVKGPQVDIGKGYWGSLYAEGYDMMKKSDSKLVEKAVKGSEANQFLIVAKGNKVTITVNGATMVDDEFKKLPSKKADEAKDYPSEGIIAFQIHGGYPKMKIEYTDIVFKKLSK